MNSIKKISFFGAGLMGIPMIEALLDKQFELTVWNRSKEKLLSLKEKGAKIANSIEEAINNSDIIITMLLNYDSIKETIIKYKELLKNKIFIQMSTISPLESEEINRIINQVGGIFIEAPVLGTNTVAKNRKLQVLVGGNKEKVNQLNDILSSFGTVKYYGEVPFASKMKLIMNQLVISETVLFAQSLAMCQKEGLNVENFLELLRPSSFYCPYFDIKGSFMFKRDYSNPNFQSKAALKDINLILEESKQLGLNCSLLESIQQILQKSVNKNPEEDFSNVYEIIRNN